PMSDDLRARIDTLFDRALDLPPEERLLFVRAAAAGDPKIERGVVELLRLASGPESDDDWSGASESLWMELVTELESPAPEMAGTRVGPWRLIEEIGRGGMGTVFLAERADGEFEQ